MKVDTGMGLESSLPPSMIALITEDALTHAWLVHREAGRLLSGGEGGKLRAIRATVGVGEFRALVNDKDLR